MSEKVERLRAFYELFNQHAFEDALRYLHPEIEIFPAIAGVLDLGDRYRGREESLQFFERLSEGFDVMVTLEEVIEVSDGSVLMIERWRPRGREGIETEARLADLYTFRDGLVFRVEGFRDPGAARRRAGLKD